MKVEDQVFTELLPGHRGHFGAKLAEAWQYADSGNRAKLEAAFPNYFLTSHMKPGAVVQGTAFSLSHASATREKALTAAANVETIVGRTVNGDAKALRQLSAEDLALLVQFVRNSET